jgi:putative NADPH-quinone reductase
LHKAMNILAIVASPRRKGLVSTMAQRVLDGAASNGRQVELVNLYDHRLDYCLGCWACAERGRCVHDDAFNALFEKVKTADVLVLAAPVYWSNVPGIMKTFFDRHCGAIWDWSQTRRYPLLNFEWAPLRPEMRDKRTVLILACSAPLPPPLGRLPMIHEVSDALQAMVNYTRKLEMKVLVRLVFTNTKDPQFVRKHRERFFAKAYEIGRRL